jgi:translation elongation factor EF-1beta
MTATITNANTNIPEMGEAMKYVAPQARALGVSLEETATAIGVLSNSGIKATMAGTGLSTMLVRLASPTGAAADALNELGIKVYDANGKFVGLTNILRQFKEKMAGMSQEMKAKYLRDIFGLETLKTAITLIDSVGNSYDKLYEKIAKSMGVTQDKVKQMTDTFNGHLKELESAFQGLIITIGNELLPALTDFVKWLTKASGNVEKFYSENKELINTIAELTAVFFALSKVKAVIEGILGAKAAADIAKMAIGIKGLKDAVLALGAALGKLGKANAVILALTLAIEGLNRAFDKWEEKIKRLDNSTRELKEGTKSFNDIIQELQSHMKIDENGIKTFTLTKEEIEKLKKKQKL